MTGLAHILYAVIDLLKAAIEIVNQAEQRQGDEVMKWVDKYEGAYQELRKSQDELAKVKQQLLNLSGPMKLDNDDFKELLGLVIKTYPGNKIRAIKAVRAMTGLGLKESKMYVEDLPEFSDNQSWKNEDDDGFYMKPVHD